MNSNGKYNAVHDFETVAIPRLVNIEQKVNETGLFRCGL